MKWNGEDELVLWLVRHGESTWNILGLVQGQTDESTLTRQGHHQAERLAEVFQDLPVVAVYSSDLRRAHETANVLGTALGLHVRPCRALRERSFGVYENRPLISLCPEITGIQAGRVVDIHAQPEAGESLDDVYSRASMFIDWLRYQRHSGDVVAVAHGGSVREIRAYCAGLCLSEMPWDEVPNASVWRVALPGPVLNKEPQRIQLESGGIR
jgi:2,3-bisphosphoglycerate-dependent phosphoglycerate mutase